MADYGKPIDQARDPYEYIFRETGREYLRYLQGEYGANYKNQRFWQDGWEEHYRRMRMAIDAAVWGIAERRKIERSQMALAVVGPGIEPADRDYDRRLVMNVLQPMRAVVCVDIAREIIASAMLSLATASQGQMRTYGMQYDITSGLSTAYGQYIGERIKEVETEEQLARVAEDHFGKFDIAELEDRLRVISGKSRPITDDIFSADDDDPLRDARKNEDRKFKISIDGEHFSLDLISLQMVLAGTGAAAEAHIWSLYQDIDEQNRGKEVSDQLLNDRRQIFRRIYRMISRFNTEVSLRCITRMLQDNPQARIVAITDITTHIDALRAEFKRLDLDRLTEDLEHRGIALEDPASWVWKDEPEHHHGVKVLEIAKNGIHPPRHDREEKKPPSQIQSSTPAAE